MIERLQKNVIQVLGINLDKIWGHAIPYWPDSLVVAVSPVKPRMLITYLILVSLWCRHCEQKGVPNYSRESKRSEGALSPPFRSKTNDYTHFVSG